MRNFFSILSKARSNFLYFIFMIFLTLTFLIPLFFYLQLPKKLNLRFFSIYDLFFKIYKIHKYFFNKFKKSKIPYMQKKGLNFFIKNSRKKSIFYFKLNSFEDIIFSFFLIDENLDFEDFLYFKFLNLSEYNFIFRDFLKNINEIYLNEIIENKNLNVEKRCKIVFFFNDSEVEKANLNFENYNYFLVSRRENLYSDSEEEIFEIKNFSSQETIVF